MTVHLDQPSDPPELHEANRSGMSRREIKALIAVVAIIIGSVVFFVFVGSPFAGAAGGCGGG